MRRLAPFVLVVALAGTTASAAHAQQGDVAAQALFEEGRAALARGDYATACAKLEGSRAIDPAPGTEYNLAVCYDRSGRTASAWAAYLNAAAAYKATNRPEWATKARERAEVLSRALPRLLVAVPDAVDARITRDGAVLVASELGVAIPVDPGTHVVTAEAQGRAPFRAEIAVAPGATETVRIVLGPAATHPAAPGGVAEAPRAPDEDAPGAWRRPLGVVTLGVGAAGVVLGTVAGLVALERHDVSMQDCPESGPCASGRALDANRAAHDWASVSTVGFVAGGVLLAAGAVMWLTAPKKAVALAPHGVALRW